MSGSKTGTPGIVKHSLKISELYQKYGASNLATATNQEFADCVVALIQCTIALALTDDYLLQKDRTGPAGPEDPI